MGHAIYTCPFFFPYAAETHTFKLITLSLALLNSHAFTHSLTHLLTNTHLLTPPLAHSHTLAHSINPLHTHTCTHTRLFEREMLFHIKCPSAVWKSVGIFCRRAFPYTRLRDGISRHLFVRLWSDDQPSDGPVIGCLVRSARAFHRHVSIGAWTGRGIYVTSTVNIPLAKSHVNWCARALGTHLRTSYGRIQIIAIPAHSGFIFTGSSHLHQVFVGTTRQCFIGFA